MSTQPTLVILYEKEALPAVRRLDHVLSNEGFTIETDYKHLEDIGEMGWIPVLNGLIGRADAGILVRTESGLGDQDYRGLNEELFVVRARQLPLYATIADFWLGLTDEEFRAVVKSDFMVWLEEQLAAKTTNIEPPSHR